MYGDPGKGHTIEVNKEVTILGSNAGNPATGERDPEAVVQGYIKVTADDVTIDGLTIDASHKSGGDHFIDLDGGSGTTFVNNIATVDTKQDSGGNGVLADNADAINNNIFAWSSDLVSLNGPGGLLGRGDTGLGGFRNGDNFEDNEILGAQWGSSDNRNEHLETTALRVSSDGSSGELTGSDDFTDWFRITEPNNDAAGTDFDVTIETFDKGTDQIDLRAFGFDATGDIEIEDAGSDSTITINDGEPNEQMVTVNGVTGLSDSDFLF